MLGRSNANILAISAGLALSGSLPASELFAQLVPHSIAADLSFFDTPLSNQVTTEVLSARVLGGDSAAELELLELFGRSLTENPTRQKLRALKQETDQADLEDRDKFFAAARKDLLSGSDSEVNKYNEQRRQGQSGLEIEIERHNRLIGSDPAHQALCDWSAPWLFCYDYTFMLLRREPTENYHSPHGPQALQALFKMGYEPTRTPQDFDVVLYYRISADGRFDPQHWGMVHSGKVVSKNVADCRVYYHDIDAQPEPCEKVIFFSKRDPSLQNPLGRPFPNGYYGIYQDTRWVQYGVGVVDARFAEGALFFVKKLWPIPVAAIPAALAVYALAYRRREDKDPS